MLLTIYVPTFKRRSLYECLESIAPQIVDGVELIVSDNDPDGSAWPIVARFPVAQYVKQSENLGCDGNCLNGLSTGTGRYVWVFGDDDAMLPFAVERTLPLLDGTDRIIHFSPKHGEVPIGFDGTMPNLIYRLHDKSFIVASTLCSMNVWRRDRMDIELGEESLETRNVLAWAGLKCLTVKVLNVPTVLVQETEGFALPYWNKLMEQYVRKLSRHWEIDEFPFGNYIKWNWVNIR